MNMNLLGKLFIVLIFIGSIMLMSFSVALYATHKNWKKQADTLTVELDKKKKELTNLQDAKAAMEAGMKLELKRQVDKSVGLARKTEELKEDYKNVQNENARLIADRELAQATTQSALAEVKALRERLDEVSETLVKAQREWVEMSTDLVKEMDKAHSLAIQLANYQSTCAQLAKDYRDAMEVLRIFGRLPNPALYQEHPPAGIQGIVTEVRERGVIEISIGSDSGLVKGHQLDIVRNRDGRSSYIGKIEVTHTLADRAVAKVMPEFRRGVVQRGDEVTYIEVNELAAH